MGVAMHVDQLGYEIYALAWLMHGWSVNLSKLLMSVAMDADQLGCRGHSGREGEGAAEHAAHQHGRCGHWAVQGPQQAWRQEAQLPG